MDSGVIVAVISGIFTIGSVVITNRASNKEITHKLETHQAVTDTKIEALTSEVREHNGFARRMPVVEEKLLNLERRMDGVENEIQRKNSKAD